MTRYALPLLILAACAGRQVETNAPEAETSAPDGAEAEVIPTGPSASATADDLEVTLTIDQERYTAKANTIRCVTEPCPSNAEPALVRAAIEIENLGDAPKTLAFTSGQRFNLVLLDDSGEVLQNWAADKLFMQALEQITLSPGENQVWTAELAVTDQIGAEAAGELTLQAEVIGYGPKVQIPLVVELEGS